MKRKLCTLLGLISLAVSTIGYSQQSVSSPVGFHTEIIKANAFSLLGVNVTHRAGSPNIRTIGDMFGANNETGIKPGTSKTGDVIWVPDHDGGYTRVFYNHIVRTFPPITIGWRAIAHGNRDMSSVSLPVNSGIFYESRSDHDWHVVFGGHVPEGIINHNVKPGINILNRGYPVHVPLNESGIEISPGFKWGDSNTGDIVWIFKQDGNYDRYFYTDGTAEPFAMTPGWKRIGSGNEDHGRDGLSSAFIIEVRGYGGNIKLLPPPLIARRSFVTSPMAPPRPMLSTSFEQLKEVVYFVLWWSAYNADINYTTEVYSPGNWFFISTQTNLDGQPLSNFAPLSMWNGVARVVAHYKDHILPAQ